MTLIINEVKEVLNKIYINDFDKSDIAYLLVKLRTTKSIKDYSILYDVANFVVHSEGRDKGITFLYASQVITNFIDVSIHGGVVINSGIYSKEKIIEQIIRACESILPEKVFKNKIRKRSEEIIQCIIELLNQIELHIKDKRVKKCILCKEKGSVSIQVNLITEGPVIVFKEGSILKFGLFK